MTPLPKKKHAKSRTRTRKAAIKFTLPNFIVCPNCQSLKLPHKACSNCGYYSAKITVKVKNEKKK